MKKKPTKTDKDKPLPRRRRVIVKVHGDPELSSMVQKIAFAGGFTWAHGKVIGTDKEDCILFGWHRPDEMVMYSGSGYTAEKMATDSGTVHGRKPPILDARKHMGDILHYFTGDSKIGLDILVSPRLEQFIRAHPGDEMVGGFIRKEIGLNLPETVQKNGADSILDWIVKNKTIDIPKPSGAIGEEPVPAVFMIKLKSIASGRDYWDRVDEVWVEGEVPQEVIEIAMEKRDSTIISAWMLDHAHNLEEVKREERERNVIDTEYDDDSPEFRDIIDSSDIKEKLKQLMKKA